MLPPSDSDLSDGTSTMGSKGVEIEHDSKGFL